MEFHCVFVIFHILPLGNLIRASDSCNVAVCDTRSSHNFHLLMMVKNVDVGD